MGCGGSKQHVVPYDDRDGDSESGHDPVLAPKGKSTKSGRFLATTISAKARQVDRKENRSFFDKSRTPKQFEAGGHTNATGHKSMRAGGQKSMRDQLLLNQHETRVAAFNSRRPHRLDPRDDSQSSEAQARSRFVKSIKAVTDAMFGPPPEWILRQTSAIKAQFQFMGVVGKGQFGQVYCIKHTRHNVKYACKTLGKKKLLSQLDAEDIKREIEVMHHLSGHDLVVSLHRVYEDEKNVHLVMDLCSGGDLYELLRQVKYLPEQQAAPLMLLALRAVQYCHSMGVVHRDIKPENFLLSRKDDLTHIKLTDFGLSTFYQEGQVFNELLGSPYYIAPEVIKQKYGKEADVWSCGVMLYIMLCGEAPFFGEGDEGIFKSIMKAKLDFSFEPWPGLSREVKMLLRRMLVKNPLERATLDEIISHPWFERFAPAPGLSGQKRTGDSPALPPMPPPHQQGPRGGSGSTEHTLFMRLKRYSAASRTKKAALRYIVASLPDEVTAGLYNLFQDFDQDANNAIDARELRDAFARRNVILLEEEAKSLVAAADLDGDGMLSLVEWMSAAILIPDEQVESLASEAFAFIDADRDNYIGMDELVSYLDGCGFVPAAPSSPSRRTQSTVASRELAEMIMAEADSDLDGRLSEDEFLAAYTVMASLSRATSRPGTATHPPAVQHGQLMAGEAGAYGATRGPPPGGPQNRVVSVTSVKSFGGDAYMH